MVMDSETGENKGFTDDEAALYDRQIRLWGVDAQKRLNNSKILIIGLGGVGAEVAKNIILGGVKAVTLMDSQKVTELDASSQFLVPRDAIGQNRAAASLARAQQLNPMVQVTAEDSTLEDKTEEFFTTFSVIIATNCSKAQILRLNRIAREKEINFVASDVFGFLGYIFLDLGEHSYQTEKTVRHEKGKPEVALVVGGVNRYITFDHVVNIDWNLEDFAKRVKKTNSDLFALFGTQATTYQISVSRVRFHTMHKLTDEFVRLFAVLLEFVEEKKRKPEPATREADLEELLKLRDAYIDRNGLSKEKVPDELFETVFGEVGPTSAITGGVLAQEVVKAVSQKDPPFVNIFFCNPLTSTGYVENLVDL